MKIGFDISQTGKGKAGCGYFADSLVRHLAAVDTENDYVLYPTFGDFYWDADWKSTVARISRPRFETAEGHKSIEEARHFWHAETQRHEAWLGSPDIVHANNFYCPEGLTNSKLVYTLYDIAFVEHPNLTTEANRVGCFHGAFLASIHADFIVAISEFSRQHFLETFPYYPAEQTAVVHLGSRYDDRAPVARPKRFAKVANDSFWLCVGTIEPRKNYLKVLEAMRLLKAEQGTVKPLLIAGRDGWLMQDFSARIKEFGLENDVTVLGYVDDKDLQWLYQNCFALVYPSLWEGFGLPVLEAMSQGAPVITSNNTSLAEVAGDAALLVDPYDERDIRTAMLRLQSDDSLRAATRKRSELRAADFSWHESARKLIECYGLVMENCAQVA